MEGILAIRTALAAASEGTHVPVVAQTASDNALAPVLILVLCVVAGLGTVLLLPSKREAVLRKIGGVLMLAAGLILAAMLVHFLSGQGKGQMSIYFWIFSAIAIVGAIRVITHPRPVYSALYFVLSVLATAGLFILLWAEFMAAALVIIYAGAILVTYVFVIMLATQSSPPGSPEGSEVGALAEYDAVSREPLLASAVGFTLMGMLIFVIFDRAPSFAPVSGPSAPSSAVNGPGSVQVLGRYLFQSQIVNLELAGLILTIAMVGAILIARRQVIVTGPTAPEVLLGPSTPVDDNPHSIPVYGTDNPRQKAYPET